MNQEHTLHLISLRRTDNSSAYTIINHNEKGISKWKLKTIREWLEAKETEARLAEELAEL